MLVMVNLTGLSQTYWRPRFEGMTDKDGLWFWSIRWFQLELTFYSRELGSAVIENFNDSVRDWRRKRALRN